MIVGPSGSGKSTLCRTINRLETIDSGEILIDGVALPEEGKKLAVVRSQVGTGKVAIQVQRAISQLRLAFETADDQVTGILSS